MILRQDQATSSAANACGNCGMEERRLLHHVRHRGIFRRLCTTCVLRLHPQSFCPTCFQVYPPTPSHDAAITCFKCYSSSHSNCVSGSLANHYICPLCINPNTPIFNLKKASEANVVNTGEELDVSGNNEVLRVIDRNGAKIFLAAAKIAAASMSKAAVAARAEAERRAKEAAFTRKRAKEALEHVAQLVVREKLRKKEAVTSISPAVHTYGSGGGENLAHLGGGVVRVSRENDTKIINTKGAANGNMDGAIRCPIAVVEMSNSTGKANRVDNSNQVLAALNAVELRENEENSGIKAVDARKLPNDNFVPMDVDNNVAIAEKNGVGGSETSADLGSTAEDHNMQEDKIEQVIEGMLLAPQVDDQMQLTENKEGHHYNGTQHNNG